MNNEYVGFAIRRPNEDGAIVYVFDVFSDGVKLYGGYRMLGETEKHTNLDDASILYVSFCDGTMPITVDDFNDRVKSGETSNEFDCNVFIRAEMIGKVEFSDNSVRKGLEDGDDSAFQTMFYQCMNCLQVVEDGASKPVAEKKTKAKQKKKS